MKIRGIFHLIIRLIKNISNETMVDYFYIIRKILSRVDNQPHLARENHAPLNTLF